jgi:hypothetical protein
MTMRQARVTTLVDGLKLHSTPSQWSKVIDIAAPGAVVQVLDEPGGRWTQVLYKGQRGYMGSSFLVVEEEPAPRPTVIEPTAREPTPPDYGPPMWMFIAGIATIVLGFIGAVAIVLR